METTTLTTKSGTRYIICGGDMLTRLSDHPMRDHSGNIVDEEIYAEEMTNVSPVEAGKPLRCTVMGKPLVTSTIVKIEWTS